jgi:adenine C2-methylase RlmN of 23S rRNA A2503 and tRNA A37
VQTLTKLLNQCDSGHEFQKILNVGGFPCAIHQRRGIDVATGCGILKEAGKRARKA